MSGDREVGGIRCMAVLERLSAYVDDELAPEDRARIEAHLVGCDWCERYGRRFAETVGQLRRSLRVEPMPSDVATRIDARLGLTEE